MYMRFEERAACTIKEAMEFSGLGHTKIYEMIGDGRLDTVKIDSRRLVKVPSLLRLFGRDDAPGSSDLPDRGRRSQRTKTAEQPDA
jgi:predicted DNA-binding transcriptional regulator AlpA